MGRPLVGFPNRADAGTLSGGSWSSALPLTNMQDRRMHRVARSSDALEASTTFDADLGAAYAIRVIALSAHNLSLSATVRVYADDEATFTSPPYDSTALSAYPTIYPSGATLWGASVGSTALSAAEYAAGARSDFILVLSAAITYRYWRVAISDTGNADGYVQVGRLWLSDAWEPSRRFSEELEFGWETTSTRTDTDSGGTYHLERPRRRYVNGVIPDMEESESMVQATELQRRVGTHEQVFFVFDDEDTVYMQRRAFVATAREISPLRIRSAFFAGQPIRFVEEL